jgi:SAM-dependent methyltransferase
MRTSAAGAVPPSPAALWERQARQWSSVKPPLRPGEEDLARTQEAIDRWTVRRGPAPSALMLGVTPELATLRWPPGSLVAAVDLSMPMIREVWPGWRRRDAGLAAIRGDWRELPFAERSIDIALGDNCLGADRRAEVVRIVRSIRRVLRVDGEFLYRGFLRPDPPESPEAVWDDLEAGRIGSFGVFKFRLLMSIADPIGEVRPADAWEAFRERCPDAERLARHLRWPVGEVRTIEAYRGQSAVYWFPTLAELRALLAGGFEEVGCRWPAYEMGDRCPTFEFRADR